MGRSERDKGIKGEREVATVYELAGLEVRGLESTGDHLVVCGPASGLVLHSEVKRQETARVWLWWEQAHAELEPGAVAVVAFRRNRSPWLALTSLAELARLVGELEAAKAELEAARHELAELADQSD